MEWRIDGKYTIRDERESVDRDRLFGWLSTDAYWWSKGITRRVLDRAIENSLDFSCLHPSDGFVGFGRMVTDYASFAYWCDVYVDRSHRGRGIGRALTSTAVSHHALSTCRRISLLTRDAHGVYEGVGFRRTTSSDRWMEIERAPGPDYTIEAETGE